MPLLAPAVGPADRRRRWVVVTGVTALILLDVVLVVWVLGRPSSSEAESPIPGSTTVAEESPLPSGSASASPSPSPSSGTGGTGGSGAPVEVAAVATVPPARILTAVDEAVAWRATTGSCPAAVASPELTTDGGATWTVTDATGPTGVTALQRIISGSREVATMVGLAEGTCAPTLIRTYVSGDNYAEYPAEVASSWHIDPADGARVVAPAGAVDAPCAAGVVAVAPASETAAAVLCADASFATTADAGVTWSAPVAVAGAQALTPVDGGYLVARLGGSACAGIGLSVVGAGADAAAGLVDAGCVPVSGDLAALAGEVAVSDGGGTWWVWAGETLVRSTDRGASWQ